MSTSLNPNPLEGLAAGMANPYPMYKLKWWVAPDPESESEVFVFSTNVVFEENVPDNRRDWFIHDMINGMEMQGYRLAPSGEASFKFVEDAETAEGYHTEPAAGLIPMPTSVGANPNRP